MRAVAHLRRGPGAWELSVTLPEYGLSLTLRVPEQAALGLLGRLGVSSDRVAGVGYGYGADAFDPEVGAAFNLKMKPHQVKKIVAINKAQNKAQAKQGLAMAKKSPKALPPQAKQGLAMAKGFGAPKAKVALPKAMQGLAMAKGFGAKPNLPKAMQGLAMAKMAKAALASPKALQALAMAKGVSPKALASALKMAPVAKAALAAAPSSDADAMSTAQIEELTGPLPTPLGLAPAPFQPGPGINQQGAPSSDDGGGDYEDEDEDEDEEYDDEDEGEEYDDEGEDDDDSVEGRRFSKVGASFEFRASVRVNSRKRARKSAFWDTIGSVAASLHNRPAFQKSLSAAATAIPVVGPALAPRPAGLIQLTSPKRRPLSAMAQAAAMAAKGDPRAKKIMASYVAQLSPGATGGMRRMRGLFLLTQKGDPRAQQAVLMMGQKAQAGDANMTKRFALFSAVAHGMASGQIPGADPSEANRLARVEARVTELEERLIEEEEGGEEDESYEDEGYGDEYEEAS